MQLKKQVIEMAGCIILIHLHISDSQWGFRIEVGGISNSG